MRILILNWRDIKNPQSGGAEVLTHEIAKRLVKRGHNVIQFSSIFRNAKSKEIIDGVEIIRRGYPDARHLSSSVQYQAFKFYKKELRGQADIVIDEIHGVPFFTPFYIKEKKIVLICEVAGKLWDLSVAFPFNILGKILERIYPIFYQKIPIITISKSSEKELYNIGFPKKNIKVISLGSSVPVVTYLPKKEEDPTLIFVARTAKAKGIEDAIDAISLLSKRIPNLKLWILGRGDKSYVDYLNKKIRKARLSENIIFFGFVSEKKKIKLLTKAHILIAPSVKEGWGLTIHEAGSRGTPSIVYNVVGLRDVVKDGVNGLICSSNARSLAKSINMILNDERLYKKLQKGAIEERKKYSWEKTLRQVLQVLK